METTTLKRVEYIFRDICDNDDITEESSLLDDLELSSIESFTALAELEREFKILIPQKYMRDMITIADVVKIVESIMNK